MAKLLNCWFDLLNLGNNEFVKCMNNDIKYINIRNILKESNSSSLKKKPRWFQYLLEKIIKQDEINNILNKYSEYNGVDFLPKIIEEFNISIEIEGKENLPENGRCIFIANHPFGFLDGLILANIVAEKYGIFKAIGNEAFLFIPNLRSLIATVNVFGSNSKKYLIELEKLYESDMPITHFPSGLVSRIKKGKVQDSKWEKSFIKKAVSSKRNIVPFYFYGRNSYLFYFVNIIRRTLRIKTNLELALLSREMFKKRNKTIKVKIGKPISYQKFDKTLSYLDWTQEVKSQVYNLKKKE